ncbi:MAG: glycosyltransferase [Candidatus Aminicenantes bacterium]|jgi:glycosyltransferase involved in cell wall biosynthesis
MKILIIAYYYPPINTGGTLRPLKWAQYLLQWGHEVTILTHTYDKTKTEPGPPRIIRFHDISYNKKRFKLYKKGVAPPTHSRSAGWSSFGSVISNACFFCKLLKDISKKCQWLILRSFTEILNILGIYHSIYSWWKGKVIKNSDTIIQQAQPDIIIATYPPVETLEIGLHFSKKYNIPLISDFRDGLMFEPIEIKRINQYRCIRKRYKEIEAEAAAYSTAITTVSQPIMDYYKETYQPEHSAVITNAFDPKDINEKFLQGGPGGAVFSKSAPPGRRRQNFNIVFTGRFSLSVKNRRVDFFFDAVRLLLEKEKHLENKIKIHLVGEYCKEELQGLKDLIARGMVINHGLVERGQSLAFQRAADLLLIITEPERRSMVTAKIFEYLYAGKPILALTYKTVLEDIIKETKSGWIVHPHQPEAIADLLGKIISDKEFYNSIQPDGEKIEQYSIKTQVERLNRLLEKI